MPPANGAANCPLCYKPIRVPLQATEVQAFARHFNGECKGRAKRPQ